MRNHIRCLLAGIIVSVCQVHAQIGKMFDADNQLPSSFVNQVYLDRDGFMWTTTRNGLCRYDGYQFHIFKKEDNKGLASNYVNCITQDSRGLFYIGMFGALQTYNGTSFQDIKTKDLNGNEQPCYITCFAERSDGTMFAGSSGHGLIIIDSPTEAHQIGGELKEINTINDIFIDKEDRLWISTAQRGLLLSDGKKILKRFFTENGMNTDTRRLCEDRSGNLYVGTSKHGVFKLSGGSFQHVDAISTHPVTALYGSRDGRLWVGYDGNGINVYDPKTNLQTENPYYSRDVRLSFSKVYSIAEDPSGNLWIGMLQKGIYVQPNSPVTFNYMGYKLGGDNLIGQACIISSLTTDDGSIWIGTDKDGIYQYNPGNKSSRHITAGVPSTILTMTEDPRGRIFIGSYLEGFGWVDKGSGQYHPISLPASSDISVFGLDTDDKGNVWIGTMGSGLIKMDPNGNFKTYKAKNGVETNRQINSLVNDYISKLSVSPDGTRVYIATSVGLCCFDVSRESWLSTFGSNSLLYGTPIRIVKEYGGHLWIGTSDGLYSYDLKSHEMTRYSIENGLSDNGIASIEQDSNGILWISTDHGLNSMNPETKHFDSYFVDNGLQSNEFSDGASNYRHGGKMLFGGVGGITWFDPKDIRPSEWKASLQLADFLLHGSSVGNNTYSGHYLVTDTTVIATKKFNLSYRDNSFTIQLSTLTYDNPEHITYLYSINDGEFVRLRPGQNEVTFSNLTPGKYHFRVKAERNDQVTDIKEFTVVIHSPWYRTWWAYTLYALILGFAVWQYVKLRNRREEDKLRLQEHMHAEEMSETKLKFFMNISHEIRTPMTLIITPLLSLMKNDDDPQRLGIYKTIKRNAERILHLINQMMDLRKIDKGMMQMRMQETDLVGFVGEIRTLFENQATAKQIQLTYEHDTEQLPVWIDRGNFDKVIVNILSNAFKFTPMGGKINIRVTHDNQSAEIAISDNGEKIPEDKLDKIFERFYQSPTNSNDRDLGTGIGLDLTRSLVELHYGAIKARNLSQGCEFTVSIPLGKEHLKPEEIMPEDSEPVAELVDLDIQNLPEIEEEQPRRKGKQPMIVIAEDDDEIREYLTQELSNDYEIIACVNGRQALGEIYRNMPDLVVSDVMMPEMDGNTLCSQIKSNHSTNHIPVVMLTAKTRDEDKLQGLETGADAYIVKPFNMDILRHTLHNLINSHMLMKKKFGQTEKLEEKVDEIKVKSPNEKLLERVMATINKHLDDPNLSVDMIAEKVGISRVHLHRKMKELTGQTPHDFIRNIRLKQAAKLLASQGMNISEVVYACGFSNAASFSTMFKSVYGMSPRDYMKQQQKNG